MKEALISYRSRPSAFMRRERPASPDLRYANARTGKTSHCRRCKEQVHVCRTQHWVHTELYRSGLDDLNLDHRPDPVEDE